MPSEIFSGTQDDEGEALLREVEQAGSSGAPASMPLLHQVTNQDPPWEAWNAILCKDLVLPGACVPVIEVDFVDERSDVQPHGDMPGLVVEGVASFLEYLGPESGEASVVRPRRPSV